MGETEVAGALAAWEEADRLAHGLAQEHPTAMMLVGAGRRLAELVRRAYEPGTWTVLGVWDNDEAVPVGAIAGRHAVHGDMPGERAAAQALRDGNPEFIGFDTSSFYEQGVWATSVSAPDGDTAQDLAAAEMMQDEEGELHDWIVETALGTRVWRAEDEAHAREQHIDAFPDEEILEVRRAEGEEE